MRISEKGTVFGMFVIFLRAVILYIIIVLCVRLMGKRQIGQLQPSELVVTILVSNIATLALEDVSIPLVVSLSAIFTLVSLDVVMSWLTLKSHKMRSFVCGRPRIIISNGVVNQKLLRDLRFSIDDIMEGIRSNGVFDICEVQLAIVETTGAISVYQKFEHRSVTHDDMEMKGSSIDPPLVIIKDGHFQKDALAMTGLGEGWLDTLLKSNNARREDVFLLTADKNGQHQLIVKEGDS